MDTEIDWNDVIKKEARGMNDLDLGEVQEVMEDKVVVQKGIIDQLIKPFEELEELLNSIDEKTKARVVWDSFSTCLHTITL